MISSTKWLGGASVLTAIIQIAQLSVLARLLSPAEFGLWGMVTILVGLGEGFADMGLSNALIHHQNIEQRQLSSLFFLNLAMGLMLFLAIGACSPLLAAYFREDRLVTLAIWASLSFLVTAPGQLYQALLQKELHFQLFSAIEVASAVMGALTAISLALAHGGVMALLGGQLAAASLKAILLSWWGARHRPISWHFALSDVRHMLSFGLFQMGERMLNYFSRNLDKLLIGRLLGTELLGIYQVANQLMMRPMTLINPTITRVAFPAFSSIQDDDERLRRGYLKVIQLIAFVSMPIYFGMAAAAEPLVAVLLGPDWSKASSILSIMCLLGILYSLGNPIGSLLLAKGRADLGFLMNLVGIVVYSAGIFIGAHWGIHGIVWGMVAACVFVLFPLEFWLRWLLIKMKPGAYILSFLPSLALSSLMALGVSLTAHITSSWPSALRLTLLIMEGMLVYSTLSFMARRTFALDFLKIIRNRS